MLVWRLEIPDSSVSASRFFGDEKADLFCACRLELDRETFEIMWEMSKPGSETEGLFLRIDQKDYYEVQPDQDIPINWMPDVRSSPHHHAPLQH